MSSVELTLYTPMLFVAVFLIVQAALVWHGNQVASAIAREVSRVARAETDNRDLAAIEAWGVNYADAVAGNGLHEVDVDVVIVGDDVRVTVRGRSLEIVEGVSPWVEETVQGPIEEFKPDL